MQRLQGVIACFLCLFPTSTRVQNIQQDAGQSSHAHVSHKSLVQKNKLIILSSSQPCFHCGPACSVSMCAVGDRTWFRAYSTVGVPVVLVLCLFLLFCCVAGLSDRPRRSDRVKENETAAVYGCGQKGELVPAKKYDASPMSSS